jgi:hypothetical protein
LNFHPLTHKASFIPYDYDWSLGVAWSAGLGNNMGALHPEYYFSIVAINDDQSIQWQQNSLYWHTICHEDDPNEQYLEKYPRIDAYRDAYEQYVGSYADCPAFFYYRKVHYEDYENDIEEVHYFNRLTIYLDYYNTIRLSIEQAS